MPAPIAAAPILRRTRRLLLTSKRCVVGDGSDMAPPERPLNNIPRWNCAATGTRLGERLDCPAVCPIYHMAPSSIDPGIRVTYAVGVRAPEIRAVAAFAAVAHAPQPACPGVSA